MFMITLVFSTVPFMLRCLVTKKWNDQSLRIIPHAGPDLQNDEMYNRYLSSHVVIGALTPAANYGPGLTDLWTLWVLKRVQNDPIDPISRLNLVGIKHYIQ
ncbi:MAG: hypothetical protein NXY57DRAFT_1026195 [Lentinula lateritia]|nr:MAG: hypothetical protein NXY57DRAFT_1026195 [Lentinula lateritia]